MRITGFSRGLLTVLVAAGTLLSAGPVPVTACTRALYVAKDGTVIVGRSMDWGEDMMSNMWESNYGMPPEGAKVISLSTWPQYVLDNFETVAEAVADLRKEAFRVQTAVLGTGRPASMHSRT